jgi:hypothetical protein
MPTSVKLSWPFSENNQGDYGMLVVTPQGVGKMIVGIRFFLSL